MVRGSTDCYLLPALTLPKLISYGREPRRPRRPVAVIDPLQSLHKLQRGFAASVRRDRRQNLLHQIRGALLREPLADRGPVSHVPVAQLSDCGSSRLARQAIDQVEDGPVAQPRP